MNFPSRWSRRNAALVIAVLLGLALAQAPPQPVTNVHVVAGVTSSATCPTSDVKTVKTSGGDFATLTACGASAAAGRTCVIYAGTYAGVTQTTSGSAGSPITYCGNPGDTVTITSTIVVSGRSYIKIQGLAMSGNAVTAAITNRASQIKILNNTLTIANDLSGGIDGLHADNVLIDGNEFINGDQDYLDPKGLRWVVRNNHGHGQIETTQHNDFLQITCGATSADDDAWDHLLVEANLHENIHGADSHFVFFNEAGVCQLTNYQGLITRFNFVNRLGSFFHSFETVAAATFTASATYHNTVVGANLDAAQVGTGALCYDFNTGGVFSDYSCLNNISDQAAAGSPDGGAFSPTTLSGHLSFIPSVTLTTTTPLSTCVTAVKCKINQDPLFTNTAANNFALQGGSPALNLAQPLTTVTSGCGTTTLTLGSVGSLKDAWFDGDTGDVIAINTVTNTATITAVNYTAKTLTFASAPTCTNGQNVWLYQLSDGTRVLFSTTPDSGACQTGSSQSHCS